MPAHRSAIALPFLLIACSPSSPEAQVKRAFETCVKGVESGDGGAVIERLDPTFSGPEGMDRSAAKLYLMGLLRSEKIGVTVVSNKIELKGKEVIQIVDLLLTSRGGGLLPQDASHRAFLLRWTETDGTWRLKELVDGTADPAPTA